MFINLKGTIRATHPENTLSILQDNIDVFGITRIADITQLDSIGIPVSVCVRPNAKTLSVSQGKGVTNILSKISSIMEAIELWSSENIQSPTIRDNYLRLSTNNLCLKPSCLYTQYFEKKHLDYEDILWVKGAELTTNREAYIPYDLLSRDNTVSNHIALLFENSTNGLAAGNTWTEAMIHGLCEVIERHNFACWLDERKSGSKISLSTISSELIQSLINKITASNSQCVLWKLNDSINVPSFLCMIIDANQKIKPAIGKGTHPIKEIAVLRAITEAAQSRLTVISGSRDDIANRDYQIPFVEKINDDDVTVNFENISQPQIGDSLDDIMQLLINRVTSAGFNKIFVYKHKEEISRVRVVTVIIPGAHVFNQIYI